MGELSMAEVAIHDRVRARPLSSEGCPHVIEIEPSPRRVRVMFGGEIIADSTGPLLLLETGCLPVYYFPRDHVRMEFLFPTKHHTTCPYKGRASYWTVRTGGREAENAAWGYPDPIPESRAIAGAIAFYWDRMDAWFEEDEEIFVHPRSPYVRVDVVPSSRHVRVTVGGEVVAATRRARFLFETGLPTRYYIPPEDVRLDLLEPSATHTRCPYKGVASYWHVRVGDELRRDLVWSYPDPIPECPKIKGLMCFYNEFVDEIAVDGVTVPKAETPWSRKGARDR
jgi:uncharacterized protein (DUF427 family)